MGDISCPTPEKLGGWDGKSAIDGWAPSKEVFIDPANPPTFNFVNAWIYDPNSNEPDPSAKCHYEGIKFSQPNGNINSLNYHFNGVPRNGKHPGFHCKAGSVAACIFVNGPSPEIVPIGPGGPLAPIIP